MVEESIHSTGFQYGQAALMLVTVTSILAMHVNVVFKFLLTKDGQTKPRLEENVTEKRNEDIKGGVCCIALRLMKT